MALSPKLGILLFSAILGIAATAYAYYEHVEDRQLHKDNQEAIISQLEQIRVLLNEMTGRHVNPLTGQP